MRVVLVLDADQERYEVVGRTPPVRLEASSGRCTGRRAPGTGAQIARITASCRGFLSLPRLRPRGTESAVSRPRGTVHRSLQPAREHPCLPTRSCEVRRWSGWRLVAAGRSLWRQKACVHCTICQSTTDHSLHDIDTLGRRIAGHKARSGERTLLGWFWRSDQSELCWGGTLTAAPAFAALAAGLPAPPAVLGVIHGVNALAAAA